MKENVLPSIAGVVAGWAIVGGVTQAVFALMGSGGFVLMNSTWHVCAAAEGSRVTAGTLAKGTFPTDSICWPTGVKVREGKRYRITMTIDDNNPWKDGDNIYPGVGGFGVGRMTPFMYPGLLFRRLLAEPWFKPIARIGAHGNDEYPLNPGDLSSPDEGSTKLVADITARRSGELFLFVNDAVLPVPNSWQYFYNNNHGTATVSVEPVTP